MKKVDVRQLWVQSCWPPYPHGVSAFVTGQNRCGTEDFCPVPGPDENRAPPAGSWRTTCWSTNAIALAHRTSKPLARSLWLHGSARSTLAACVCLGIHSCEFRAIVLPHWARRRRSALQSASTGVRAVAPPASVRDHACFVLMLSGNMHCVLLGVPQVCCLDRQEHWRPLCGIRTEAAARRAEVLLLLGEGSWRA
jgi:hypothetical protein